MAPAKSDNWRKLTAGESGIHAITRFPTEGLKTSIAGTVDFVTAEPLCAPILSERLAEVAAEEAVGQSGIGTRATFPGRCSSPSPPVEIEWEQRRALAKASGANDDVNYDDLLRASADISRLSRALHVRLGRRRLGG